MNNQATILTAKEIQKLQKPLPESMIKAAGLMRHKKQALERHLRRVRLEWDRKA